MSAVDPVAPEPPEPAAPEPAPPEQRVTDPDRELMRRVQEGDGSAFEALVTKYQGLVLSLVRRYLGSRYAGVEDVGQQVFVRVYRARQGWQPRAQVKTWIYSITVNACLNEIRMLRSEKHRRVGSFTAIFGSTGDDAEASARGATVADTHAVADGARLDHDHVAARVRAAVDALPEQQRLAMVLSRFHACSHEEVAATMGTSVPAVKSLLLRARDTLRRMLSDLVEAGGVRQAPS
jgi:RNA polymerase sigma-70 factor, ECF subfamily